MEKSINKLQDLNHPKPGTIISGHDEQGYTVIGDDEEYRQVFLGVYEDYKEAFEALAKL